MSKISVYTENNAPLSSAYVVLAYGGQNYRIQIKNLLASMVLDRRSPPPARDDMMNNAATHYPPGWLLATGAANPASIASEADHPGIIRISSGASAGADLSYIRGASLTNFLLTGNEETDLIFRLQSTSALRVRFGFSDSFSGSPPSDPPNDGVYINVNGTTVDGRTSNNGSPSTTSSSYSVSTGAWYRMRLKINEDLTRVDFYLFDDDGTELWTDYLTTNLPSPLTGLLTHALTVWKTTAGATALIDVDLITLNMPNELMR